MHSSLLQALLVAVGLAGCSSAFRGHHGSDRLDVLTSFSLALSKYDFREAAAYLAPADRAKLAGPEEGILPEYRNRVRAIRRTTLLNNPLIEVRHGLIYGIPDVLPVLAMGEIDTSGAGPAPGEVPAPVTPVAALPDPTAIKIRDQEGLKKVANAFFRAVSRREWKKALAYVDEQERENFLDGKGAVKGTARQRLTAVDTAQWEALTLKDGKLTGVVLIIPDRKEMNRPF